MNYYYYSVFLFFVLIVFEVVFLYFFLDFVSFFLEILSGIKYLIYISDLKLSYDDLVYIFDSDDLDKDDFEYVSV